MNTIQFVTKIDKKKVSEQTLNTIYANLWLFYIKLW